MTTSMVVRWLLAAAGGVAGYRAGWLLVDGRLSHLLGLDRSGALAVAVPLGVGLLGLMAGGGLARWVERFLQSLARSLHRASAPELVFGTAGLLAGLVIAWLLTAPFPRDLPVVGDLLPLLVTGACAYVGMTVGARKHEELAGLLRWRPRAEGGSGAAAARRCRPVVVDTSAIIDGRVVDICRTGFLEATLIVPAFVLHELQRIADSPDPVRRHRGRRGLDVLAQLQKEPHVEVRIVDVDGRGEVDQRLIRLAREMEARVLTSDFNLNKVAALRGVPVLNVNELANALKPQVLPGEEMSVQLVRDGKEQGQGVGYLQDGTMVVVEGGQRHIGETVDVTVTSVLQTSAGRLIFARPKVADRVAH